jgi:glyoxylase-like metal-dependent hydrolase (beta-lactamase superfamily II)
MLDIKRFPCNMLQTNCYVVSDETHEAVIIDCSALYGNEQAAIQDYIEKNELKPRHLLATHGHADHNLGNKFVADTWGLKARGTRGRRAPDAEPGPAGIGPVRHRPGPDDIAPVGRYLHGDDVIAFGNHRLTIIETPGHTPGGVVYYCKEENTAFTGDTLFHYSIGRTDLPGGSMFMLIQSLRMLCQLPDNTRLYPGHGDQTTIGIELAGNPYLDR